MRRAILLAALLLPVPALAEGDPLAAIEQRQQALFEQIAPSVVFISRGNSIGSGFFVSADGLVLTNAHVVGDAAEVTVVLHDGRRLTGKVEERAGEDVDLALVRVPVGDARPLELGSDSLEVGSWVGSVGHGMGGAWTFTTGMVSNIYPEGGDRPVFQTQIPLNPGNSGGPVFDRAGRVVGVVTAGITEATAINFAIRIELAHRWLKGLSNGLVVEAPAGTPIFVAGVQVGVGPRVVVPAPKGPLRVQAVVGGAFREFDVKWPEERTLRIEAEPTAPPAPPRKVVGN